MSRVDSCMILCGSSRERSVSWLAKQWEIQASGGFMIIPSQILFPCPAQVVAGTENSCCNHPPCLFSITLNQSLEALDFLLNLSVCLVGHRGKTVPYHEP